MNDEDIETEPVHALQDGRMTTKNAARYLGLSEKTLAMMRSKGTGPNYVKRGRVFYFKDDLDDWIEKGRVTLQAQVI